MSASAQKYIAPIVKGNVGPGGKNLYYNNAGLFSDPYLEQLSKGKHSPFVLQHWETEPLPEFSACYEWMLSTWAEMKDILPKLSEAQLEEKWIKPILQRMGWDYEVQDRLKKWGKTEIPDYSLFESRKTYLKAQGCKTDEAYFEHVLAVADAKQMGISLDGSKLDKTNPSYQIIWYQQITGKQWGILTDGRYWRLYSTRAQSKFTTFYEVNIEKLLVERDDERFKYFFNMFRKEAFVRGQENNRSFLDVVFESGEHYAREVETRLKDRAFHLVELICQGFLSAKKSPSQEELNDVYQHSLFYLFRLMFILNCEARELLSVDKQDDYYSLSLRALCYRLREENDRNQKWSGQPRSYNCISDLFALLKNGDERIGIHGFGKEVFSSGRDAFYRDNSIPDAFLNKVLIELAFAEEKKTGELKYIDYKRLAADHLGSLFEGLLEFQLQPDSKPQSYCLVNSSGERKATGSYYTPEYVVDYIVSSTLAPLCKGKDAAELLELKIADPAMGSGHFLLGAVRYLEEQLLERFNISAKSGGVDPQEARWKILHSCIYGVDLNPLAVELAKFSLWMYTARKGYELEPLNDQLKCANSLTEEKWDKVFPDVFKEGGFSGVVGNPPYVRSRFIEPELKEYLAKNYEVASYQPDTFAFFMELGLDLLREGGTIGLIVPNGILTNTFYGTLRKYLLQNSRLQKVVDLKGGVFAGAAVDTSVLIFSKPAKKSKADNEVLIGEWPAKAHGFIQDPTNSVPQSKLLELPDCVFNSNADNKSIDLTERIKKGTQPLGELCEVKAGMKVRKDLVVKSKESGICKKFLLGRDIEPYRWDPLESTCRHASLSIL